MHVGVPIWWWLIFSKPSNPRFRGKVVQKCPIWGHHTQIHDLTALNAGIRREKNIYFCTHLYHRDHADRLFPAIYVGAKINQYLILRLWGFFGPKSLLMCIPNIKYYTAAAVYYLYYLQASRYNKLYKNYNYNYYYTAVIHVCIIHVHTYLHVCTYIHVTWYLV